MSKGPRSLAELEPLLQLLDDPTRLHLFAAIAYTKGQTAKEIAERSGLSVGKVNYRLRGMITSGLVKVSSVRRQRGAMERRFEVTQHIYLGREEERLLTAEQRNRFGFEVLRAIFSDVTKVMAESKLSKDGDCFVQFTADVDRQGWEELAEIHTKAFEETQRVREAAAHRLLESAADPVPITSVQLLMERAG